MKPILQAGSDIDLEFVRARLNSARAPQYWRSLEQVADATEFEKFLGHEFPDGAAEWQQEFNRRGFLKLMGASVALAGLTACTKQPVEKIVPYVKQPEELVPGQPLFFATAMALGGFATGLLVESHEGHPTKIEGNPQHPASLGATNVFAQAAILGLYDPDRSQSVSFREKARTWNELIEELRGRLGRNTKRARGEGVAILTEAVG